MSKLAARPFHRLSAAELYDMQVAEGRVVRGAPHATAVRPDDTVEVTEVIIQPASELPWR